MDIPIQLLSIFFYEESDFESTILDEWYNIMWVPNVGHQVFLRSCGVYEVRKVYWQSPHEVHVYGRKVKDPS